jgi:hypothetical protein
MDKLTFHVNNIIAQSSTELFLGENDPNMWISWGGSALKNTIE